MLHLLTPSQALARRAVAVGAAPSSANSCACSLRTALPSFASPSPSSSSSGSSSSSHFHTSAVAHGKSRPGEGKDAKLRRKKLARAGGVRETKDESTPLEEAIRLLRAVEIARPMNAYELHVVTSVGSHQSNSLRGRIALPRDARTKSEKLVVFASEGTPAAAAALAAKNAAARPDDVVVGGSEMIADVTANRVSGFTKVLATPDLMPQISKELARSLGPRGLMPSAKRGTVVNTAEEMRNAIEEAKGAVDWRGDRQGVVRAAIGRISFTPDDVQRNITSLLLAIVDKVSSGAGTTAAIFSGTNALEQAGERGKNAALARKAAGVIRQVHLSSTQGPGVLLNVGELV